MEKYNQITKLCEAEVRKNIVLVETGGVLTLPLKVLNENCEFRKVWNKAFNRWHPDPEVKAKIREYNREYYQKPEVKAKIREYNREYYQKPEVKAKRREYYQNNKDNILNKLHQKRKQSKLNNGNNGIPPKPKDLGILPTII